MVNEACRTVPLNGTRTFTTDDAGAEAGRRWTVTGGLRIEGAADQDTVVVRGERSGTGTLSAGTDQVISLTVVDLREITVTLPATPPSAAGRASRLCNSDLSVRDKQFTSTRTIAQFPDHFDNTVLVLLRGSFPAFRLAATVAPGATEIGWTAERNSEDHHTLASAPVPTLSARTGTAVELSTDATGSFFVHARATCACGGPHADLTRVLCLVLVEVTLADDRTAVSNEYFSHSAAHRPFDGPRGETEVVSGVDAIAFDADLNVLSGGDRGRLYLTDDKNTSAVGGGWCNTVLPPPTGAEMRGTYTGGRIVKTILTRETHPPHGAAPTYQPGTECPEEIQFPVCDSYDSALLRAKARPEDRVLSRGEVSMSSRTADDPGQRWTVTAPDSPNDVLPLCHPGDPTATLTGFDIDNSYLAGICVWTRSAPWIVGVIHTVRWSIRAGWTVTAPDPKDIDGWTARTTVPPAVTMVATTESSVRPADEAGVEMWLPGALQHLGKKTY